MNDKDSKEFTLLSRLDDDDYDDDDIPQFPLHSSKIFFFFGFSFSFNVILCKTSQQSIITQQPRFESQMTIEGELYPNKIW